MSGAEPYVLSVVVGTLNRLDRLRECIDSIRDASIPIKIYVTDAGSTDGTIEYLRKIESDCISVTLHQKKLGQAKAYNEIFAKISTPYVCWLSDDNVIVDHGLEKAVRILDANPLVGMVGLKVKDVQGPFSGEPYIGGISETGILNVNQGVLRTEILQALGGFNEEFMDYGIDPDLTARVLYAGHDIVYTKDVAVLHWRDWGESEVLRAQMAKQERYKALYRKKYCRDESNGYPGRLRFRVVGAIKRVLTKSSRLLGSDRAERWARDWYNVILGQYISLLDPIRSMGEEFHLLQRCDRETVKYYSNRFR
ncbi:glycosyltransferase [Methylocaldum sp.]|uniref:glycosyltransferase family 2 protein n=1 Tax=Methylocaldum sp. TaxID=1969727 RepID=UPI003220365B